MKKYVVKTDYASGLMFDSKDTALEVLEATSIKRDYNDRYWSIDDREMSLFIIDDSEIIEPEKKD